MKAVLSQPFTALAQVWEAPLEIFNFHASVRRVEEALLAASTDTK
jgi:hypothetical protein